MKATVYDIMDAIGNVSDYVVMETSARSRQVKERAHIRWAVTAACICYIAVMALIGIYKSGLSMIEPPSGMFLPGKEVMGPSDIVGTDTAEPREPRPCDSILKVLRGEGDFRTSRGEYLDLEHIYDYLGYDKAEVTIKFTPIDMDGEGTFEAVFEVLDSDGYLTDTAILYMYNGEVYVTSLPPRGLSDLKIDGTFFWWDITEHSGFSRIESFTDSGEVLDYFLYWTPLYGDGCYYTEDGERIKDSSIDLDYYNFESAAFIGQSPSDIIIGIVYLVDNEKVAVKEFEKNIEEQNASVAEYNKAVEEQNAKEDVTWYDLADMDDLDLEKYYGDGTADADTSTDTDTTEPEAPRPRDSILKVLEGEGEFRSTNHSYVTLKYLLTAVSPSFTDLEFDFDLANFAPMDLDGDGTYEAVFKFKLGEYGSEGYIILYMYDGEVYSTALADRQGYNLKADGTFGGSSGAGEGGLYKITSFTNTGFEADDFTYQNEHLPDEELWYVVDHEPATEEEFWEALDQHDKQEDVEWKRLADVDLEKYFE